MKLLIQIRKGLLESVWSDSQEKAEVEVWDFDALAEKQTDEITEQEIAKRIKTNGMRQIY